MVGFAAMLGLMVFITAIGLIELEKLQKQSSQMVENHMAKIEITTVMYDAARQRIVTMQKMTAIADPFERDELAMNLDGLAAQFANARMALLAKPLSHEEQELLALQGERTSVALPIQRHITDLLVQDRLTEANNILVFDAIPAQDEVLKVLDRIYRYQLKTAEQAAAQARQTYFATRRWMVLLAVGAVLLGIGISFYTLLNTAKSDREREHNLAEIQDMNTALTQSARRLAEAKDKAHRSSESKSAFLANMSHEIRTPLTAVIGFSDLLLEQQLIKPDGIAPAQAIARNGKHLLQIINEVLDLSKIEAGKLELDLADVSPFDLADDIAGTVGLQAQEKGLEFHNEFCYPLPSSIRTDELRLKQILINLCNNAVKFTHKGGVRLVMDAIKESGVLQIGVIDTGIGMTQEQQQKVFDSFSQADVTTTRQYGGSGLGLTICQLLAGRLGATLNVESELDRGSRFLLQIPLPDTAAIDWLDTRPTQPTAAQTDTAPQRMQGKVLLVEDSPDNRQLISMYLIRAGVEVSLAQDGHQGVEQSLQQDFDVILMDMQMPVMDGWEATRLIRDTGNQTPIIAFTANAMKEDIARCLDVGCNDYLAKPINKRAFFDIMARHLKAVDAMSEATQASRTDEHDDDPGFQRLVNKFLQRLPAQLKTMENATLESDWTELAKAAHNLKGMGGSFGFQELSDVSLDIEQAAKAGDSVGVGQAMAQLRERLREITKRPQNAA